MTEPVPFSLPRLRQLAFVWGTGFVVFLGFVWIFNDVLLPFVLGMGIAYLLDPLVEGMVRMKTPRWLAALIMLLIFFVVVLGALAVLAPFVYHEAQSLIETVPSYIEKFKNQLAPYTTWAQERLGHTDMQDLQQAVQENIGKTLKLGGGVLAGLAVGGQALVGFLTTFVITPIVAFFAIIEWPRIKAWFYGLLPRDNVETVKDLLHRIDRKIAGFVRGQLVVAVILSILYATALSIAGLNFGFLIGLMAGLLSIIPLFGSTAGLLISVIVAWFQAESFSYTGIIALIFFTGQFIEGNFLTPRFLGQSVGMHPLWILFVIMAGGSLFGIVGMLLAVPAAAAAGVLMQFAITRYKQSDYYRPDTGAL